MMKKSTSWIIVVKGIEPALLVSGIVLLNRYFSIGRLPASAGILPLSLYFFGLHGLAHYDSKAYSRWISGLTLLVIGLFICIGSALLRVFAYNDTGFVSVAIWELCPNGWLLGSIGLLFVGSFLDLTKLFSLRHSPLWSTCLTSLLINVVVHLSTLLVVRLFATEANAPFAYQLLWGNTCAYGIVTLLAGASVAIVQWGTQRWQFGAFWSFKEDEEPMPLFYQIMLQFFCVACLMTNIGVVKCVTFWGHRFTAGVFPYVLTFVCTDVMSELFGAQLTKRAIWAGFVANILLFLVVTGVGYLPLDVRGPVTRGMVGQSFYFVSASIVASLMAYLVAQFTDVYIFDWLRKKTHKRHLWLRNNTATCVSQLVDTVLYATLAWTLAHFVFGGDIGTLPWATWYKISRNEYGLKIILALLDTPIVYFILYTYRSYHRKMHKP